MSPILIRPVREQLEHDRIIRLLESRWRAKYQVESNVGDERNASVKFGPLVLYPDVVLSAAEGPKKLQGVVEVETGESVNNLEAMAQWAHFARVKAPFHLYVPTQGVEIARRLCDEHGIVPTELWSYYTVGEQIGFTLVQRAEGAEPTLTFDVPADTGRARREPTATRTASKPAPKAARPERPASGKPAAKPAATKRAAPPAKARPAARPAVKKPASKVVKAPKGARPRAAAKATRAHAAGPAARKTAAAKRVAPGRAKAPARTTAKATTRRSQKRR